MRSAITVKAECGKRGFVLGLRDQKQGAIVFLQQDRFARDLDVPQVSIKVDNDLKVPLLSNGHHLYFEWVPSL
jgi:hypothetical protein